MFQILRKMRALKISSIQLRQCIRKQDQLLASMDVLPTIKTMHRGVKKRCPFSAFLLAVDLEPFLSKIIFEPKLSRASVRNTMANADDITLVVKRNEVKLPFSILDYFSKGTEIMKKTVAETFQTLRSQTRAQKDLQMFWYLKLKKKQNQNKRRCNNFVTFYRRQKRTSISF